MAILKSVDLEHYMLKRPATVHPDQSLFDAIHLILVNRISGLCVVDDAGKPVGLLSELDCLRGVLSATYNDSAIGRVRQMYAGALSPELAVSTFRNRTGTHIRQSAAVRVLAAPAAGR